MIVRAQALSRKAMDKLTRAPKGLGKDVAVISITEPTTPHIFRADGPRIRRYEFWDACPGELDDSYVLMSREDADSMGRFLVELHRLENEIHLLVNCAAGISRSGAVVSVCRDVFNLDLDEFKRMNPQISPNPHVRRLLMWWWRENVWDKEVVGGGEQDLSKWSSAFKGR